MILGNVRENSSFFFFDKQCAESTEAVVLSHTLYFLSSEDLGYILMLTASSVTLLKLRIFQDFRI